MESANIKLNFRKTLVLVAVIIFLFLIPITTIVILRESNKKQIWAPMISQCPDYWKLSKTKEGYIKCSPNQQKSNSGGNSNPFFTYQLPSKQNKYNFAIKNLRNRRHEKDSRNALHPNKNKVNMQHNCLCNHVALSCTIYMHWIPHPFDYNPLQ